MLRPTLALVLLVALFSGGCRGTPAPYSPDEERPRVGYEARWWEQQGDREISRAYASDSLVVRQRHLSFAIKNLKHARDLYYDELESLESMATKEKQVPAGRREALDIEIERLSNEIVQLVRERPIEDPAPISIGQRLTPK